VFCGCCGQRYSSPALPSLLALKRWGATIARWALSDFETYSDGPVYLSGERGYFYLDISKVEEPDIQAEDAKEILDNHILHCTAARAALLKHIGDNAGAREARGSVVNELIAAQRAANSANERVLEILKVINTFDDHEAQQAALEDWSAWRG
jgi:hypothetical protein